MAKSFHTLFENQSQLQSFIEENELSQYPALSVYIYAGFLELAEITNLITFFKNLLPQAVIVGSSASKNMMNESQPIIHFVTFEKTKVYSEVLAVEDKLDLVTLGEKIALDYVTSETKMIQLFSNQAIGDMDTVMDVFHNRNADVFICGCNSPVSVKGYRSYFFTERGIVENGIALLIFDNQDLFIETLESGSWSEIGLPFTVTKAKDNIVLEINGKKPIHTLKQFLGKEFIQRLPKSSFQIPFIIKRSEKRHIAFIRNLHEGSSLEISIPILEGDTLSFAIQNREELFSLTQKGIKKLKRKPVETIFGFHCAYHKDSLDKLIQYNGDQKTPFVDFNSFGEISCRSKIQSNSLLPSSIYVTISESPEGNMPVSEKSFTIPASSHYITALTNTVNETAKEVHSLSEKVRLSSTYYQSLYENNIDVVYTLDLKGNFTSVNQSFVKAIGYNENELKGKSSLRLVVDHDIPKAQRHFRKSLNGKIQYYNINIKTKNDSIESFHIKNIPVMIDGECIGVLGIGRDISENIRFEEKITQLANYDEGTGLPNRTKFNEILEEMLQRAKKKRRALAVLFIDIDRFKMVNDTLGHYAGDLMLKELANRMKNELSNGAYLGRFTSDKFSILLTKESNPESIIQFGKQLLQIVEKPFSYQKKEFFLSASIGISMYPYDGDQSEELLKNADLALSRVKLQGGNGMVFFSDEMNEETLHRVEMESQLRRAIKNNELFLTYQPIIDSSSHKMKSCEALIRWKHPDRGIIPPFEFIPLAEETGLIHSIGKWVLKKACKQMKDWHDAGLTEASISINVSASQFQNRWFIEEVKNALAFSNLDSKFLHLELTETVMLNDSIKTIETMHALRNIGVKISIDDFGTGYSSLSYLRHLPIHILKIDKSFIQNLDVQTPDYAIVHSIMTMGQGLGLEVIAEGVETNEQFVILKNMNCNYIQGYLIEKPMDSHRMKEWLENKRYIGQ
ncbi:MAG: EAL domain-containing protein [Heyndrickxia sp.]